MSAELQDAQVLAADLAATLPPMTLAEATLETNIEVERQSMLLCQREGNVAGVRAAQEEMVRLIRQRTPAMVLRMERARGLSKDQPGRQ